MRLRFLPVINRNQSNVKLRYGAVALCAALAVGGLAAWGKFRRYFHHAVKHALSASSTRQNYKRLAADRSVSKPRASSSGQPPLGTDMAVLSQMPSWPAFRGPNRDGISPETGLLSVWPPSGPPELYRRPIGEGCAAFVIGLERAWTIEQRGEKETISCYDFRTGEELWTFDYPAIGDTAVRRVESIYYGVKGSVRRILYSKPGRVDPEVLAELDRPSPIQPDNGKENSVNTDAPPPVTRLIRSPRMKGEGQWEPLQSKEIGLFIAQIRTDAQDASQEVNLIAMDLTKLKLSYVPGTEITQKDELSKIPKRDWSSLVAMFNGGFRENHRYNPSMFRNFMGQRKDNITYQALEDGNASIIVDGDGATDIRKWDQATAAKYPSADVRQNLPMLLDDGAIDPLFMVKQHLHFPTYRTALGIGSDPRWLIFAGGDGLRPLDMAKALKLAHCRNAVHMDQTAGNVMFDLSIPGTAPPVFKGVNPPLHHHRDRKFLQGSDRDFFYITRRSQSEDHGVKHVAG